MIQFEDSIRVNIGIDPEMHKGIYIFNGEGGLGKTYLAEIFTRNANRENLYVRTGVNGKFYDNGDIDKAKLLFYDRADMYFDEKLVKEINKFGVEKPILLDLKDTTNIDKNIWNVELGLVSISLNEDSLNVEVLL